MPDDRARFLTQRGEAIDGLGANPPQRLQREGLPQVVVPGLGGFWGKLANQFLVGEVVAETLGELVEFGTPGKVRPEVSHHPAAGVGDHFEPVFRRDVGADLFQGVGFGDVPSQFGGRPAFHRVQHHGQLNVEPRHAGTELLRRPGAQVFAKRFSDIIGVNPALDQTIPVRLFAEVGFAAKDVGAHLQALVEGVFLLEGVQRVVVNEHRDRTLGRQQVRGMVDLFAKRGVCGRIVVGCHGIGWR